MHFYTLTEIAPAHPPTAAPNSLGVQLDRLTIPSEIDRAALVRRIDATQVKIEELNRWAGPLDETIHRVLAIDLAMRLPASAPRQGLLSVDIQDFYGDAACNVSLRAEWILKTPGAAESRSVESVQAPADGACSSAAIPAAMSRALAELSERISAAIATTAAPAAK